MPLRQHWGQHLPSSREADLANPYSQKRHWAVATSVLIVASVGGAIGINFIWLNPVTHLGGNVINSATTQTVTGDAIVYQFGTIQLEITATNGTIETINELQASTSSGWEQSIPLLREAALKAQSADFGNMSGATFVTEAYQKALASAISKLS